MDSNTKIITIQDLLLCKHPPFISRILFPMVYIGNIALKCYRQVRYRSGDFIQKEIWHTQ